MATITLRNEETNTERLKLKPETDLIAALIQYRESTKAAGRHKLSEWAHVQLARVAAFSHLNEDLKMVEAIVAFQATCIAPEALNQDMRDEFKSLLSADELEALADVRITIAASWCS
jgi:hypothetical protein